MNFLVIDISDKIDHFSADIWNINIENEIIIQITDNEAKIQNDINILIKFQIENICNNWLNNNDYDMHELTNYICNLLPNMNKYCMVCCEDIDNDKIKLKPSLCDNLECYGKISRDIEFTENIINSVNPNITNMLIKFLKLSVESNRSKFVTKPYPLVYRDDVVLSENKMNKNLLKSFMRPVSNYYNDIKLWSIINTSAVIKCINENPLPSFVDYTKEQYIVVLDNYNKLQEFDTRKKKYGSEFVFHGSPMENWHSIMNNGLINATNKKGYKLHGAAYGAGIYVSPNSKLSLKYSKSSNTEACMAVCEVIKDPLSLKKKTDDIWTVQNENDVIIRFFLIFDHKIKQDMIKWLWFYTDSVDMHNEFSGKIRDIIHMN